MSDQPQSPPQPTPEQQHKLEAAWVLWYDSSTAAPVSRSNAVTGWITNLKRIARFTTIEEFWGVMNSVPPASSVSQGSNYFLFKEGIRPVWEDAANELGGRWLYNVPRAASTGPLDSLVDMPLVDRLWIQLCMAMVGESLQDEGLICGAACQLRKAGDRVAVWIRDCNPEDEALQAAVYDVAYAMKDVLVIPQQERVMFQSHAGVAAGARAPEAEV